MGYAFDPNDVHIQTALTNISQAYRNDELVADRVAPRIKVEHRSDKYYVLDEMEAFNVQADRTAPNADANEIVISLSDDEYAVKDYALGSWVPREAIANADDPVDPLGRAVEGIKNRLMLAREKRVADLAFAAATYGSGYKTQLSGTTQWSHADADPVNAILTALDVPLQRPNRMIVGAEVWRVLRQRAEIVAAAFPLGGNAASGGLVGGWATTQAVAQMLELDEIVVGRARYNSAAAGQTGVLSRVWGKHALLYYQEESPSRDTPTSFFTFETTDSAIVRDFDPKKGVKGSEYVKDGWSHVEKLVSGKSCYFFEDAVA